MQFMKKRPKLLLQSLNNLFFALLLLTGCQGDTLYHSYQSIGGTGWGMGDTLSFTFHSTLPSGSQDMQIGIRHMASYPYRDIWLGIRHNLNGSSSFQTDTFHFYLADEAGNWYGEGLGGIFQFAQGESIPLYLPDTVGNSVVQIFHLMNDSVLKSISDVGFRLSVASRSINAEEDK